MTWASAIAALLSIVSALTDYARKQGYLKEADDAIVAKQVLALWNKLEMADKIDKSIDAATDADIDWMLDALREAKSDSGTSSKSAG